MTLNREQLVEKLTDIFKETDPALFPYIESIATEAKKRARGELLGRKRELSEYFDDQMKTLKARLDLINIPSESILSFFKERRLEICLKMEEIWGRKYPEETLESLAKKGIYLGIPVVPANWFGRGYYDLMAMIRNRDKAGYNTFGSDEVENIVKTPKGLYFIYDVEDGRKYLDCSPKDAEKAIKEEKRFCITAEEGIMICVLTFVLEHHNIDLTASRYKESDEVPHISLDGDVPKIAWGYFDGSNDRWGSASCHSRA